MTTSELPPTMTTTEPPPTTTTTTIEPPPTTTTTTNLTPTTTTEPLPPTTTSTRTRTRTTRTRSTITASDSPTTTTNSGPIIPTTNSDPIIPTTNSDPIIPTTSSTASSGIIVSPTLPPSSDKSGMSTGAIVGIVIAVLLALIAALISAFLIKRRRRRRFNRTSDTLFNPVNNNATLAMQESQHYHPASPRKDFPGTGGGSGGGGLRGRESVEPLNVHPFATTMLVNGNTRASSGGSDNSATSSAIAAASGLQDGGLYPFEADPGYSHFYHNGGAAGVGYLPPTEPAYSQYGGWNDPASSSEYNMMPGVGPGDYHSDPEEAVAYAQYEQEQQDMYLHQLMMMQQHGQEQGEILHSPVEYYDPIPATAATTSPPSAINSPSASEPRSVREYYSLTENDPAYNSKSEPWASPKRNPQVLIPPAATSASGTREADDQLKVQVPYANDAMKRPT
ncbi:hypothetical protein BGZ96_003127, partial [Linnemannia gamsii]